MRRIAAGRVTGAELASGYPRARTAAAAFALGVLLGSLSPHRLEAQAREPTLRAEVDTTVVTVGDPITLSIVVDHATDQQVAWPDSLELGPFEVLGARTSGPTSREEGARSSLSLGLAAYELGELEIPSFQVPVVGPQGDTTLLGTNRFVIRVESVGLDESGDIRGLKGPLGIPLSPARIALWGLVSLLALAVAWFLWRRLRRRELDDVPARSGPAAHYRPPHEVALEALAELEASPLLERGEVKEFHIRVSDVLRAYVEGRFQVPALEMTTRDILAGLGGVGVGIREELRTFLDRCDMVKFAKHRPDERASLEILALGRRLVEETMRVTPAAGDAVTPDATSAGEGRP